MSPKYSKPKRGKFKIDRKFDFPVGRIQRSSGTDDHDKFVQINHCLTVLWDDQHIQTLLALRDGKIKPLAVLRAWKDGNLKTHDFVHQEISLEESMTNWLNDHTELAERTKRGYRTCINQLQRFGQNPSVSDLPILLQMYREETEKTEHFRTFNQTRSMCLAYCRDTTKERKQSELYRSIQRIPIFGRRQTGQALRNQPFRPSELDHLFHDATEDLRKYEDLVWFLCLHGMTSKEFLEDGFVDHGTHLEILGQKRTSRHRVIPKLMEPPERPYPAYKTLLKIFKQLGRTTHDARRTYQVWLDRAQVERNHARSYMGHSISTMTSLYAHEDAVQRWIPEDTVKILEWLKSARSESPSRPTIPMKLAKTAADLGKNQQAAKLDEIVDELNNVLLSWYEQGWTRKLFEVVQVVEVPVSD